MIRKPEWVFVVMTQLNGFKNIYTICKDKEKAQSISENMPWQYEKHMVWVEEWCLE